MRLHPQGREYYKLRIETEPAALAVEASFDGGETWRPGEAVGEDVHRWLVAGPDADATGAAVVAVTTTPVLRWPDAPEQVVRAAPTQIVVSRNPETDWLT